MPELRALLTPEGLSLLDAMPPIVTTDDVAREVSRLRAQGHPPELVSALVEQRRLRHRGADKFGPFAARMLFTRAGLEQATRLSVAALHARRFREAGLLRVADLGCGLGGDALGFAGLGLRVRAVEADEVTAALAAYNLAAVGDAVTVEQARAEDVELTGVDAAWLDPARRTPGHGETTRLTRTAQYSPSLEWAFALGDRLPTGVKLGPAHPHDEIPPGREAQWITVGTTTIELVLWSAALARPGVARAATVVRPDPDGGAPVISEISAPAPAPDAGVRALGAFLHEPFGSVIRARLIGDVARALSAGPVSEGIAYLSGDEPITSPFVQSFRVRETLPVEPKRIARRLRDLEIGTLEIKKRGIDIDPAAFRSRLKPAGPHHGTLLLTRIQGQRVAILADRVG